MFSHIREPEATRFNSFGRSSGKQKECVVYCFEDHGLERAGSGLAQRWVKASQHHLPQSLLSLCCLCCHSEAGESVPDAHWHIFNTCRGRARTRLHHTAAMDAPYRRGLFHYWLALVSSSPRLIRVHDFFVFLGLALPEDWNFICESGLPTQRDKSVILSVSLTAEKKKNSHGLHQTGLLPPSTSKKHY